MTPVVDDNCASDDRRFIISGQAQKTPTRPQQGSGAGHRDRELVRFVGAHGAVAIEHVRIALGLGRTAAYARVANCIEAGLLERSAVLEGEPSVLRATRAGLRYAGQPFKVATLSPALVAHSLRCASMALLLAEEFWPCEVLSERELVAVEQIEERPVFSAKLGQLESGAPRLHRPDLAIATGDAPIAIEVELSAKAPRRLEGLMRAWRRASWVGEVRYYCEPGITRRAVERAIEKARAGERVRVLEVVER